MSGRLQLRLWNPGEFGDLVPNLLPADLEPLQSAPSPGGHFGN